jgi:hypothetical protein
MQPVYTHDIPSI